MSCRCFYGPDEGFGLSTDPYDRAIERIEALKERGQDPIEGTLRRLAATYDADKIFGIWKAASYIAKRTRNRTLARLWREVAVAADRKLARVSG